MNILVGKDSQQLAVKSMVFHCAWRKVATDSNVFTQGTEEFQLFHKPSELRTYLKYGLNT